MYDFEKIKYEDIRDNMLNEISDNIDKRPSSIVGLSLFPAAMEIYKVYLALSWALDQIFIQTQNFDFLKKNSAQYGIYLIKATNAIVKGSFDVIIPIDHQFRNEETGIIFKVVKEIGQNGNMFEYQLEAQTSGTSGNIQSGRLIPISYVPKLTKSKIIALLIPGRDEETQEDLRQRFLEIMKNEPFGWNQSQYVDEVSKLAGIGQCKVKHHIPTSDSDYNVYVYILDSENHTPSTELVQSTKDWLYQNVPFTHNVEVFAVNTNTVNISVTISISDTADFEIIKFQVIETIENEIKNVNKTWANSKNCLVLRTSALSASLFNIENIEDVTNLTINNSTNNFTATDFNIFRVGTITVQGV